MKIKKIILVILPLVVIAGSVYITLTGSWISPDINKWQSGILGDNTYFPVFTIFILALPPLLLLAFIKWILISNTANKKKTGQG
jgi:hypothetical protein